LRRIIRATHLDEHGDEGSGHFDFGGHSDLHLDIHLDSPEMLARDAGVAVSLQLREAMEKWMKLVSDRLTKIERRIDTLSGKK
jgi:hypothetical protein